MNEGEEDTYMALGSNDHRFAAKLQEFMPAGSRQAPRTL